jgi:basic amino acid/polyamine antiporter, APA family
VTFFSEPGGIFLASLIVAVLASTFISLGMRTYARIQQVCFYGGVLGLLIMLALLVVNSNSDFVSAFNSQATEVYGAPANAYQKTLEAGRIAAADPGSLVLGPTLLLIPMIVFFNLWSNWGATLYGEVKGASDFRKNVYAMGGALLTTTVIAAIMLALFAKTFGWDFYYAANNAFWGAVEGAPVAAWPYPGIMTAFFFDSPVLQAVVVGLLALWFFGWVGSVFLSSTRVVFATAFDRVLPEWASRTNRNGVPYAALALMLIPSIPISYLYAYGENFATYTLDATLVIALTFLGSAVAAAVLPWRKPEIYNASPIANYTLVGVPLVTVSAVAFSAFLIFCLYQWATNSVFGVNNASSALYMTALYVLALVIYGVSRLVRRSQGMDLKMVYDEIPAD